MSDHEVQKMFGGFTEEGLDSLPVGTVVRVNGKIVCKFEGDSRWPWASKNGSMRSAEMAERGATLVSLPVAPDVEDRVSVYLDRRLNDGPIDELPTIYDNELMAEEIMAIVRGEW